MEQTTPSLIKVTSFLIQSTEEVLKDNLTDRDKFQSLYYEILENKVIRDE